MPEPACPHCKGDDLLPIEVSKTNTKFDVFRCKDCSVQFSRCIGESEPKEEPAPRKDAYVPRPAKVIAKAVVTRGSNPRAWYAGKVGEAFKVVNIGEIFITVELSNGKWRGIAATDAELFPIKG